MSNINPENIRNVILIGQSKSGKTSLAESILYTSGVVTRLGKVEDGNTITDFDEEEIERQFTISSSAAYCDWKNHRINLIDTPGFINFIEDARGCLKSADSAVIVLNLGAGVKSETQKLKKYANGFQMNSIVFINKMDKENGSFEELLEQIKSTFQTSAAVLTIPIGQGESFSGIVDIINLKAYKTVDNKTQEIEIPSDMKAAVDDNRKKLIESIAETDDILVEKYLEGTELTQEEITDALNQGINENKFIPVICGSARTNQAAWYLLDSIVKYLPSPVKRAETTPIIGKNPKDNSEVKREPSKESPFSAFIFKTIADPYSGKLSMFRVMSGEITADSTVYNSTKQTKERIGRLSYLIGKKQVPVQSLGPGEIGVVAKLKETSTGDTLCSQSNPIVYEPVHFALPLLSYAIEAKNKGEEEKVSTGLHKILEEDPSLEMHRDQEANEMILSGMGQMHIEVVLEKLKRKFGVEVDMHSPLVPYRETITGPAKAQGKYKKQSGGRGQYGDCSIEIKPLPRGSGFQFVDKIVSGAIPRQYIPAVEAGIIQKMKEGIIAGYPFVDVEVILYDGSYHTVDSSELAFKIAGSFAIKSAVVQANPVLLEPIMKVEIDIPEENMSVVIGDLNAKRGKIQGMDSQPGGDKKVNALVPLSEMLTYANQLQSITSGKGVYTMEFSSYEQVPSYLTEKLIKKEEELKAAVSKK